MTSKFSVEPKSIKFRDWEFEADVEATKRAYSTVCAGGANGCLCAPCKNFTANRNTAYPAEIKKLFSQLGIDYEKEAEVAHYEQCEDGLSHYAGWFHFKGKILKGGDCRIFQSPTACTFELQKITEKFSIGFTGGNSPSFFESLENTVQVEFEVYIPWTISESPDK